MTRCFTCGLIYLGKVNLEPMQPAVYPVTVYGSCTVVCVAVGLLLYAWAFRSADLRGSFLLAPGKLSHCESEKIQSMWWIFEIHERFEISVEGSLPWNKCGMDLSCSISRVREKCWRQNSSCFQRWSFLLFKYHQKLFNKVCSHDFCTVMY